MTIVSLLAGGLLLIGWLLLLGLNNLKLLYKMKDWSEAQSRLIITPFKAILEKSQLYDQLSLPIGVLHAQQTILVGTKWSYERTKLLLAQFTGYGYLVCMGSCFMGYVAEEALLSLIGVIVAIVLVLRPFLHAKAQVNKRKYQMILALPDLLSRLQLLVGAGENVQRAFVKIAASNQKQDKGVNDALQQEWWTAAYTIENGQSFSTVLERFNRNCSVQEVSIFTTVLLLNYKRGGDQLVLALRELSYTLWERRKNIARMKGEEASSKLIFPLVGILLVMIVIIAAPAIMMM